MLLAYGNYCVERPLPLAERNKTLVLRMPFMREPRKIEWLDYLVYRAASSRIMQDGRARIPQTVGASDT